LPWKIKSKRPAVLGVELLLESLSRLAVGIEDRLGLVLVEAALFIGLVRFEMKSFGAVDTKRRNEGIELGPQAFFEDFFAS